MPNTIVHIAGTPEGPLQWCSRCGDILIDYRNTAGVGDWKPSWWVPGGFVGVVKGNPTGYVAMDRDAQALDEVACDLTEMVA